MCNTARITLNSQSTVIFLRFFSKLKNCVLAFLATEKPQEEGEDLCNRKPELDVQISLSKHGALVQKGLLNPTMWLRSLTKVWGSSQTLRKTRAQSGSTQIKATLSCSLKEPAEPGNTVWLQGPSMQCDAAHTVPPGQHHYPLFLTRTCWPYFPSA